MDYVAVLNTFGPAALIGLLLFKWVGGWLMGRIANSPAPVPGVPNTPLIAPTPAPTLLALVQAWAKLHGHPIPETLVEVTKEVLTAVRADLDLIHPAAKS